MYEQISTCIKKVKGDYFQQDKNLISGGYISSIDLLHIIRELEKEFKVKISLELVSPESFESVESIEKIINIASKRNK